MRRLFGQRPPRGTWIAACLMLGALQFAGAAMLRAQTGTIVGQVSDARLRGGISSVTVEVEGTRLGAATGLDGRYRIANVPAGPHSVAARRIGYSVVRQPVTVQANAD